MGGGSRTGSADYVFLSYILVLLLFGLLMLSSASSALGHARFDDNYFFIKRQFLYGVLPGLVAFFILAKLPYHFLRKSAFAGFVGVVGLLAVTLIPGIGSSLGTGAHSWIQIGSFSLQPAELAKLGTILFLALVLERLGEKLLDLKHGFLVALGIGLIPALLVVLQPDIGTVSILFGIVFGMLLFAGSRWSHLSLLASLGAVALVLLIIAAPYRAARLTTFLHPELDPQGIGYHINQASLAIGTGGVFGLGFGRSRQKFQYLPEVHADSIYAVIAEEMGLVFATGVLVLLFLIARRGFMIAKEAPDGFGRYVVGGIIIWFMVQSLMNIGAMVGLMPLTGVPLPFVSHGGTALVIAMGAVGIIMNVSRQR